MYNRYQNNSISSLSINQQIAIVLGDISQKLDTSHQLFAQLNAAESIALGEKTIQIATTFATIIDEGISETIAQGVDPVTESALRELRGYFVSLPIIITQYVTSRDQELYQRLQDSIKNMEQSWKRQ